MGSGDGEGAGVAGGGTADGSGRPKPLGQFVEMLGVGEREVARAQVLGVLQPAARSPQGEPLYGLREAQQVLLVRRLSRLGFSDAQIRELVAAPLEQFPQLYGAHAARLREEAQAQLARAREIEAAAVLAHLATVWATHAPDGAAGNTGPLSPANGDGPAPLLPAGLLQATTGLYRTLVERTPDALLVVHRDSGRYWLVNAAAERLLGYSRAELLSMQPPDITPAEDAPDLWRALEALEEQGDWRGEWRFRRKDGSVVRTGATVGRFLVGDHVLYHGHFRAPAGE